ncbi:MAG: hypothetical protein VXW14_06885, partial [Candidatus Thermoplasmatota archaeon]|nr:hypothetical protein [Candidatus Thermoplasmatota archaeon]
SADDETPYFGNAFLVVVDETTDSASQDYYDISKSNWQVEADSPYQFTSLDDCPTGPPCNGDDIEEDSSPFIIIILSLVGFGGLGFVIYNRRSKRRPSVYAQGVLGTDGNEWITYPPNSQAYFYRSPGSRDWIKFEN